MDFLSQIDTESIPKHIAIIMDGNGRWAQKRNMPRIFGHKNAVESVRQVTEHCAKLGVKYLTLFAFSTENWARPKLEVRGLMSLLLESVHKEMHTLIHNEISLETIGDISRLPRKTKEAVEETIEKTKDNAKMKLLLALNYSGKWDIIQACQKIHKMHPDGEISEDLIEDHLSTAGIPDPELIIRTSGEIRLSNFYLWQSAYTEFFFTDVLWPDFRKEDLYKAILAYQARDRRFGNI